MQETPLQSPGQEDPLEEGMATHSSILAWRIPWTEEPGRRWPIVSQSQTRLKGLSLRACVQGLWLLFPVPRALLPGALIRSYFHGDLI